MRSDCEITINRGELLTAINVTAAHVHWDGKSCRRLIARLRPCPDGIAVETPWLSAELAGEGRWKRHVVVGARQLWALANRLEHHSSARLLYVSGMLYLNNTGMPALEPRPPVRLEPVGAAWQTLLPGVEPITLRDRLDHLAGQPLRARVGQRSLPRDGLFGGER